MELDLLEFEMHIDLHLFVCKHSLNRKSGTKIIAFVSRTYIAMFELKSRNIRKSQKCDFVCFVFILFTILPVLIVVQLKCP